MDKFARSPESLGDTLPAMPRPAPLTDAPARAGSDLSFAVSSDRHQFAAKVRAGRAILGWSQTELARRTGLSQRSIYRLELAAVDVRRSTVVSLETVFANAGVDFEHLADGGFKVVVSAGGLLRQ
jgi:DNA-binding XRE family transcriptional regulator